MYPGDSAGEGSEMSTLERICMIGPSYPFRGGIAHYTTLLYRALRERHDVKFYAFKRQYPLWLYPGRTDRDPSSLAIKEDSVECVLDSLNPFTWWQVAQRIRHDSPDLLIIPWWVTFWTLQFWSVIRLVRRSCATKILFICHNVVAHEARAWDRLCTKLVLRNGDCFIVHSDEDLHNLKEMLPQANARKVFHPTYDVFGRERLSQSEAQKRLGISGRTLLFFGFVRPYKGLEYLLDAMPAIVDNTGARLLVAGEFWRDKQRYVEQICALGIEDHVTLVDRYIANEEVGVYFSAADAVVLPYITATQTGIVQIAYAFGKPAIVTNVGGLPEAVEDGKTGFVVAPEDSQAIARAVLSFYESSQHAEFARNIACRRLQFSWNRIVEVIDNLVMLHPQRDRSK